MDNLLKPGKDYIGITTPFYCNDGKGNFVMHKRDQNARDEQGTWDCGGGQLDFGEELEEAVLREVKEEYGCEGAIQEQLPAHSVFRVFDGVKVHWLATPFFIKIDVTKAKITEPHKFSEIGIFTLDNFPQPLHSGLAYSMKKYKKYWNRYK